MVAKADNQPNEKHMRDWLARTCELVDNYKPEVVWFDWWIEEPAWIPYIQKFAAFYYNRGSEWGKPTAINYKKNAFPEKAAVYDIERGKLDQLRPYVWQTDTSIGLKSWSYVEGEKFRSANSLVDDLIDIVSKNGLLLLNIGPRADGTIPDEVRATLLDIGKWLNVNGEAIYGTRPYKVFGEGPTKVFTGGFTDAKQKDFTAADIRFTTKGTTLYAIALDWPSAPFTIASVDSSRKVASVTLLGSTEKVSFQQTPQGLKVTLPSTRFGDYAHVLKIQ